ncbi:MAG: ABC transporter permease [Caldisericaceae bacterium]|nr:ABC transporter permease [Caldisericaceae bacterium]
MQRLLYLIQKEFRQIAREKTYIGIIFVVPILQLVVIGFAVTTDVKNVPTVLVNEDRSSFSRRIEDVLQNSEQFNYLGRLPDMGSARIWIKEGRAQLALIIPPHFERDLKSNQFPQILAIIDGVDGNSAGVIAGYIALLAQKLQIAWLPQMNISPEQLINIHLVEPETRMLYNPDLESVYNIVPGILALLIMIITAFLTGMSIVREKEIGTLEQLMVTPIRNWELLGGKIIPLTLIVMLLFNVGMVAARLIFGLWMAGSLLELEFLALLFALSGLSLGIFISTIAHTQQQAMFLAWFFMVFSLLLSGFFIPIENMPPAIQAITYLNPVRYFMVIVREIYLKGTPLKFLWQQAGAMTLFGLSMFILASLRFQKRLG